VRILFLSHRVPYPPRFGSQVRAFNTIRHLSREHEVIVLAPIRSQAEADEARELADHCREYHGFRVRAPLQIAKMVATLPTPISASEAYFHSASMAGFVDRLLAERRIDMVFVHCSSVGRIVEHADIPLKLIDFCDVDSQKLVDYAAQRPWPLSMGYRWEALRLAGAERRLARSFDCVTVATPGELQLLRDIGAQGRSDWFPNGVDIEYFCPDGGAYDPRLISFIGRMDYFPNEQAMLDFCATVWPRLRQREPRMRLQIVGADPTARIRRLEHLEGVQVTGAVPDVRPYVRNSALTIVPLKIARGTQNKVLESMALGVPVVSSPIAAGGVDAHGGAHLLVASTPDEWVESIFRGLEPETRRMLSEAGRARVVSNHTWPMAMRRLDRIMESLKPGGCVGDARAAAKVAA
jgi:hypothetical protein